MISHATDADLPDLVSHLRALNAFHAEAVPERFHDNGDDAALLAVLQAQHARGGRFLLYRTEGVLRGYLKWQAVPKGEPALERAQRLALLDHIYVEPIWRRRGLASRLIAAFEAASTAEGFTGWTVRVHAFNRASAALMQRHGAVLSVQSFAKHDMGRGHAGQGA